MALAKRGLREIDGKHEKIDDPAVLLEIARRATRVHLEALALGVVLAALTTGVAYLRVRY